MSGAWKSNDESHRPACVARACDCRRSAIHQTSVVDAYRASAKRTYGQTVPSDPGATAFVRSLGPVACGGSPRPGKLARCCEYVAFQWKFLLSNRGQRRNDT